MLQPLKRTGKLSGEQLLAALALLLITGLVIVSLIVATIAPGNVAVVAALASSGVTALASLVRRHDQADPQQETPGTS